MTLIDGFPLLQARQWIPLLYLMRQWTSGLNILPHIYCQWYPYIDNGRKKYWGKCSLHFRWLVEFTMKKKMKTGFLIMPRVSVISISKALTFLSIFNHVFYVFFLVTCSQQFVSFMFFWCYIDFLLRGVQENNAANAHS